MNSLYVLSNLPKAGLDRRNVYANCALIDNTPSRRELVAAIDFHGLNIYNLRSTQLVALYSLSPSTQFTCSPLSVVDTATCSRRTYASYHIDDEAHNLTVWRDGRDSSEVQQSNVSLSMAARGIYHQMDCILVILDNGTFVCFDLDLTKQLWQFDTHIGTESIVHHSMWSPEATFLYASCRSLTNSVLFLVTLSENHSVNVSTYQTCRDGATRIAPDYCLKLDKFGSEYMFHSCCASLSPAGRLVLAFYHQSQRSFIHIVDVSSKKEAGRMPLVASIPQSAIKSIRWLGRTHFVIASSKDVSVYEANYMTIQSRYLLEEESACISVVTGPASTTHQSHYLAFSSHSAISLIHTQTPKRPSLLDTINKLPGSKSPWLIDIDIQATWKSSFEKIGQRAQLCLTKLAASSTGEEFDQTMETFLFSTITESRPRKTKSHKRLEEAKVQNMAVKDVAENSCLTSHPISGVLAENWKVFGQAFTSMALSLNFATKVVELLLVSLPEIPSRAIVPMASIDLFLRKGLFIIPRDKDIEPWFRFLLQHTNIFERLICEAKGLTAEHLVVALMLVMIHEQPTLHLESIILRKLRECSPFSIIAAVRLRLDNDQIGDLISRLVRQITERVGDEVQEAANEDTVLLFDTISIFMEGLGLPCVVLSLSIRTSINELRTTVPSLLMQTESVLQLDSALIEFLTKAHRVDHPKTPAWQKARWDDNPQPQGLGLKSNLSAGQTQGKNFCTSRAKGHAKMIGMGRYSIETLQV